MFQLPLIQKAIREEHFDGWFFVNFAHRDTLTDRLLELDENAVSTRRWLYFVPASGLPLKIVHAIEKDILDRLPGKRIEYIGRNSIESILSEFSGRRCAILSDQYIQVLSTFDASSADLLHFCGIETASAAPLVQRVRGILDDRGIASHEKAAAELYAIIHGAWEMTETAFKNGQSLHEGDIQDYILDCYNAAGLISDGPPIVASGSNSGNPHYSVPGLSGTGTCRGRKIGTEEVVQFDIWAKYPDGIYADISWAGFTGYTVPEATERRFAAVVAARDLVNPAIEAAFSDGRRINGSEIDRIVRSYLLEWYPEKTIQHRTGHGIDTECHGSGVNLDSFEFPDTRCILEGSCFSVEPGLYFADAGFRTEIDIYIQAGKPVVSGGQIQQTLLKFQE